MNRSLTLVATLVFALLLAGCSGASKSYCDGPPVRVATDAAFPPFHFVDEEGEVTGHDVELARMALERAGYVVRVVRVEEFSELFAGLERGDWDVVAATSGITRERERRFLFSRPYFTTCQGALVRGDPGAPGSLAELEGVRVGAAPDTTGEDAARRIGAGTVVPFDTNRVGIPALERGEIDAYVADEFEVVKLARENPAIRVLPEPAALERYGFVMRRDEVALKRELDRELALLEAQGASAALRARFGLKRDEDWPIELDKTEGDGS